MPLSLPQASRILEIRDAIRIRKPSLTLDIGSRWVATSPKGGLVTLVVDTQTLALEWDSPNEKGELKLNLDIPASEVAALFVAVLPSRAQ